MPRSLFIGLSVLLFLLSIFVLREAYNSAGLAILAPGYQPSAERRDLRFWALVFAGLGMLAFSFVSWRNKDRKSDR